MRVMLLALSHGAASTIEGDTHPGTLCHPEMILWPTSLPPCNLDTHGDALALLGVHPVAREPVEEVEVRGLLASGITEHSASRSAMWRRRSRWRWSTTRACSWRRWRGTRDGQRAMSRGCGRHPAAADEVVRSVRRGAT